MGVFQVLGNIEQLIGGEGKVGTGEKVVRSTDRVEKEFTRLDIFVVHSHPMGEEGRLAIADVELGRERWHPNVVFKLSRTATRWVKAVFANSDLLVYRSTISQPFYSATDSSLFSRKRATSRLTSSRT